VLVSGTFWEGASFKVLKQVSSGKHQLIVSVAIIEEYHKVLESDEIVEKAAYKRELLSVTFKLLRMAKMVKPSKKFSVIEDPEDNKFLDAAVAGKASFLISQDGHLLKLGRFRRIRIMTPEDFLNFSD
jgi:putative PIN family toxin of toxin-antitoxin system